MIPQDIDIHQEQPEMRPSTSDPATAATPPRLPESSVPLFAVNDAQGFRSRWERIQIGFVDEPRKSVEQADELVAITIKRLAEVFAAERNKLEAAWDRSDDVSTEDLRVALRRYRSFFDRLLSV